MGIDITKQYSHPTRLLPDHLQGVAGKVLRRTTGLLTCLNLKTAEIAALFHDIGKLNPHFQAKLSGAKTNSYSSHAYLSAFAWFCFAMKNAERLKEWFGDSFQLHLKQVAALIARHHGDLPDFGEGIFNQQEAGRLTAFLADYADLPVSQFLRLLKGFETHIEFTLQCTPPAREHLLKCCVLLSKGPDAVRHPLDFFLETQFGFACLLEADKRDAGDNQSYKREELRPYFKSNFAPQLFSRLEAIAREAEERLSNRELNRVRTLMREEAVANLRSQLQENRRVLTLAAPTGAGKTLMLLSLAQEILAARPDLSVIYALPFLSITEQVEAVCRSIFDNFSETEGGKFASETAVLRFDSRAENKRIENLQREMETEQSDDKLAELLREDFSAETFDHPFIVTTFVQVFETLVSNRNATLLRLPNFSRSIFLLDEIQALPPRLYTFFVALLDEFCRQFDSYAIISTATMPYLKIEPKVHVTNQPDYEKPEKLFVNYQCPPELLNPEYFSAPVFNRYRIKRDRHITTIEQLAAQIEGCDESCLVILNTIGDTRSLYDLLSRNYSGDECVLLNTHFTLNDRRKKLQHCQQRLADHERIILVSTQLIEAGVDIDFPVLYRDLCPLPNLIQSAGRCNRNGKLTTGEVHFIALQRGNGKTLSAQSIYRGRDKVLLDFGRDCFPDEVTESEMKSLQEAYFEFVGKNLAVGEHEQNDIQMNLIRHINKAEFDKLGRFRLIDEQEFGEEYRYFIPRNWDDERFEELKCLTEVTRGHSFAEAKKRRIAIEIRLREMSADLVQFRLPKGKSAPQFSGEILGIRKLADPDDYSGETGIRLETGGCII
ncbi:MAG: CRISPR-associated helicase Cas3' [Blastocatellia bacterium]